MKSWHRKAIDLYGAGVPIKAISETLKKDYHTVYVFIKRYQEGQAKKVSKLQTYYKKLKAKGIVDNILELLQTSSERKGRKFPVSISRLYSGIEPTLKLHGIKIKKSRFYELLKYIIYQELGSVEKLNNIVYDTPTRNRAGKGIVKRQLDCLELDATGITIDGTTYSVIMALDEATGYLLPPYIVEAKARGSKYYNTAINSVDIARYLRDLFIEYGVPATVKTDNEETLSAEIIKRAFKQLGVKTQKTKAYNPQQKLVERVIRTVKDYLGFYKGLPAKQQIEKAVETWNNEEHKFKVYPKPIRPVDYFEGYREVEEDSIRKAFRERFERTVRNSTINIDGKAYQIMFPETKIFDLYGRDTSVKAVVCYRDIENITILDVYSQDEQTYFGVAKLVSQTEILDTLSERQEKNRQRRAQKRETKLRQELAEIEASKQQTEETQIDLSILQQPATEQQQEEEISVWKILTGGQ